MAGDDYRRGAGRPGRDVADTNYGAMRPREGLAAGQRNWITTQKMTRHRLRPSKPSVSAPAGARTSGQSEERTGNAAELTYMPEKFYATSSAVSNLGAGEVLDGINTTWTLQGEPLEGSVQLYFNGQWLTEGIDFSVSGSTITWLITTPAAPGPSGLLSGVYYKDTEV